MTKEDAYDQHQNPESVANADECEVYQVLCQAPAVRILQSLVSAK
jgi:hypothetical protein